MSDRIANGLQKMKAASARLTAAVASSLHGKGTRIAIVGIAGAGAFALIQHPPFQSVGRGEVGLRLNRVTGSVAQVGEGAVVVLPAIHELRRFTLRDQVYRPPGGDRASGAAPYQSVEGLSIGVDIAIRYALDSTRIAATGRLQPDEIGRAVVEPAAQGVLYKTLSRYTVREIFSSKRPEIQHTLEAELKPLLEADGIRLQSVTVGKVDLPSDYKAGMEKLLAEELATEQMRYTLELKDKQVKQTELEARAEKARRETQAEAAAQEQIIAAKAQAEAMKHVLPFKQKQIEQRALEAEAAKVARLKAAEASAEARKIEAVGEAESRRKLADAEAYRQERIGAVASAQLARDGALISKNPLLIQKTLADKLSDKISVIIAPPSAGGGFIGANLLGTGRPAAAQDAPDAGAARPDTSVDPGADPGTDPSAEPAPSAAANAAVAARAGR